MEHHEETMETLVWLPHIPELNKGTQIFKEQTDMLTNEPQPIKIFKKTKFPVWNGMVKSLSKRVYVQQVNSKYEDKNSSYFLM